MNRDNVVPSEVKVSIHEQKPPFYNENLNLYPLWNIIWKDSSWFEHGHIQVGILTPFNIKYMCKEFLKMF